MKPTFDLRLYLVTDAPERCRYSLADTVRAAIDGGVSVVQYRTSNPEGGACYREALPLAEICRNAGVTFIVNDRLDLALALEADGAHVGQRDLPVPQARKILGPDKILGLSCSTLEEIRAVDTTLVDYLGIGPVFPTQTKLNAPPVVGTENFARLVAASPLPVVAIGGIDIARAPVVRALGNAVGIAVVSAICAAENPRDAARALRG